MIRPRRMRLVGYIACVRKTRNAYEIFVENREEINLGVDRRIMPLLLIYLTMISRQKILYSLACYEGWGWGTERDARGNRRVLL